jgi:hypothetical protein
MRRFAVIAALLGATYVAAAPSAFAADAILTANMTGAAEPATALQPAGGDPDASGRSTIFIDDDSNRLCLFLTWRNVTGTLSGLHIHLAPPGVNGPIVVPFATPPSASSGFNWQCVTVENEALLDNIAANPQQYYINLHATPLYPSGAIRGQLQTA